MGKPVEMEIQNLKQRYRTLFPACEGAGKVVIGEVERRLSVRLPEDFRQIVEFWSGGGVGYVGLLDWDRANPVNLIDRTVELRSLIGLPDRFVVLAEPAEGLIVLDTVPETAPGVLWIDAVEAENLESGFFEREPDTWLTFADFFAELLDEEEEERGFDH